MWSLMVSFSSSLSISTSVALDVSLPVICPSVGPRARHQRVPQTKKYLVLVNVIQGRTCITQILGSGGLCVSVLSLSSCYNVNLTCPQQHTCRAWNTYKMLSSREVPKPWESSWDGLGVTHTGVTLLMRSVRPRGTRLVTRRAVW